MVFMFFVSHGFHVDFWDFGMPFFSWSVPIKHKRVLIDGGLL